MSSVKKRRRSSLAPFKVKLTDSPGYTKDLNDQQESTDAAKGKRLLPNPDNLAMDETIQMLEGRIERLKTEENSWNEYLKELDEKLTIAESIADKTVLSENNVIMKDELAAEYLYPMTDLEDLAKQVTDAMKKSLLLAAEHEKTLHQVEQKSSEQAASYEKLLKSLHIEKEQDLSSPRRTIQNILDLPSVDDFALT